MVKRSLTLDRRLDAGQRPAYRAGLDDSLRVPWQEAIRVHLCSSVVPIAVVRAGLYLIANNHGVPAGEFARPPRNREV
jgi:hypothetical protein